MNPFVATSGPVPAMPPGRPVPPVGQGSGMSAFELVDNEAMAASLDRRWSHRPGLLLIDPAGRSAGAIVRALSDVTGAPPSRVRVLSPAGLREVATVDEVTLPEVAGRPDVVRYLRCRQLDPATPSPSLERLWQRTTMVALLTGALDSQETSRWVLNACVLANRLGATGPHWTVFTPTGAQRSLPADLQPAWMHRMSFLAQPPARQRDGSASALWNAIFRAWVAQTGCALTLALVPRAAVAVGYHWDDLAGGCRAPFALPARAHERHRLRIHPPGRHRRQLHGPRLGQGARPR